MNLPFARFASSVSAEHLLTNLQQKFHRGLHISRICREETPWGIVMKIGLGGLVHDVITPANFCRNPIRGSGATGLRKGGPPIYIGHGPYNSAQTTV